MRKVRTSEGCAVEIPQRQRLSSVNATSDGITGSASSQLMRKNSHKLMKCTNACRSFCLWSQECWRNVDVALLHRPQKMHERNGTNTEDSRTQLQLAIGWTGATLCERSLNVATTFCTRTRSLCNPPRGPSRLAHESAVPLQCPYSALTVPLQCPYHKKHTSLTFCA